VTRTAGPAGSPAEDGLLSGLYQQITDQQAGSAGAGYDLTAGLARYRSWLRERTLAPAADRAVQALYAEHYRPLVRLAALLVRDPAAAEELVQDAFVAVHDSWDQLQDTGRALAYLRRCVVAGSRSRLDRAAGGTSGGRAAAEPGPSRLAAGQMAPGPPGPALVSVLRTLPARQREAVVLCYYAGLPGPELAAVMGVSRWSARRHLAGALAALQGRLPAAALWPAPVLGPGG
jgi:DNA-directed RNA polymerase specialized sigma24 family protein